MQDNFKEIQKLLKSSRSVDSRKLEIDIDFKESLRENLYRFYLDKTSKGFSIFTKLSMLNINKKVVFITFSVAVFCVSLIAYMLNFPMSKSGVFSPSVTFANARLSDCEGNVEMKRSGSDEWVEATVGEKLNEGDILQTSDNSRAIVSLMDSDDIRLNSRSSIEIVSLNKEDIVIEQLAGESYNRIIENGESPYTIKSQGVNARAVGTAYIFSTNESERTVSVYVFESKVELEFNDKNEDLAELHKAIINTEDEDIEIGEIEEDEYKSDFALWNKEKDKDMGISCHDEYSPTIEITSPENGSITDDESIEVTGIVKKSESGYNLRKIKINDQIYTEMTDGKGFDTESGEFKVYVDLVEGANNITIKAYDIYWNESEEVTLTITRNISNPVSKYFYISDISSNDGNIYVKWVMTGFEAPDGFKIVKAEHTNPVYPGDDFQYLSDGGVREYNWTGVTAGTYYIRVCIYNGSICTRYTANKTVTVQEGSASQYATSISIKAESVFDSEAKVTITIGGGKAPKGFKIAWSKTVENPLYPCSTDPKCDNFVYIGGIYNEGTHVFYVDVKNPGSYYFGVSVWNGNGGEPGSPTGFYGPVMIN